MTQVILIIHLLIAIVMILLILLQKSEGAAGGGFSATAGVSNMMQPRSRPNPLSRATTFLGICFFATSLSLALIAKPRESTSIFAPTVDGPAVPKVNENALPAVPIETPAAASAATQAEPKAESPGPQGPSVPNN